MYFFCTFIGENKLTYLLIDMVAIQLANYWLAMVLNF